MKYQELLKDPRWQRKRLEVLQRDNFTCQRCGSTDKTLHVHHFVYPESGLPWDVNELMLETLCEDCHYIDHLEIDIVLEDVLIAFTASGNKEAVRLINSYIVKHYKNGKG